MLYSYVRMGNTESARAFEYSTTELLKRVESLPNELLRDYGVEIVSGVLKQAGGGGDKVETVATPLGVVMVPATKCVIFPDNIDDLALMNFMSARSWGETVVSVAGEGRDELLCVGLTIRYESPPGAGMPSVLDDEDRLEGFNVRTLTPNSRINPYDIKPDQMGRARSLVMAALASGRRRGGDLAVNSFVSKEGNGVGSAPIYTRFDSGEQPPTLVDKQGKSAKLSDSSVRDLYPQYYPGGPSAGGSVMGVQTLQPAALDGMFHPEIICSAIAEGPDRLDELAESIVNLSNPDETLFAGFIMREDGKPLAALNSLLALEHKSTIPSRHFKASPFKTIENLLYTHEPSRGYIRAGRNLRPVILSPELMLFADYTNSADAGEQSMVVVAKGAKSKWEAFRFNRGDTPTADLWYDKLCLEE